MPEKYSQDEYYHIVRRQQLGVLAFGILAVAIVFLTFPICNNDRVGYFDGFETLFAHLGLGTVTDPFCEFVFWENLFPRTIAAFCIGGVLGMVGAIMQHILANPLADPYTTGISSGAGLGAIVFITMGVSLIPGLTGNTALIMNAFIMGLIPVAVIILLNHFRKLTSVEIIMVGIGLMFFLGAANSVVILAANPNDLHDAYEWGLGNLGTMNWSNLWIVVLATVIGVSFFILVLEKIRVLVNSDRVTETLGENPARLRGVILVMISLVVASMVCFTGTIGFVGIVAPHVVRLTLGTNVKVTVPTSFFTGAMILLLADVLSRLVIMPVGVITSVVGGAVFFIILLKQHKSEAL